MKYAGIKIHAFLIQRMMRMEMEYVEIKIHVLQIVIMMQIVIIYVSRME